jgi:hypothetical protein
VSGRGPTLRVVAIAAAMATLASVGALAAPAAEGPDATRAGARGPVVTQLVAFRSARTTQRRVRASLTRVRIGAKRCAVAPGTALATLVASRPGKIGLRDFGACSRRARDGGQLFVRSIRGERNRGVSGWVYKVGSRLATAGAGDPAGPFGRGRLRGGSRLTWFYCRMREGSCQRTLELRVGPAPGDGPTVVSVQGFDDRGDGIPVEGATVRGGGAKARTDAEGRATLVLPAGRRTLRATKRGLVPSHAVRATVR